MKEKISTGTIVRTVVLALALINQLLVMLGYSPLPIDDETINLAITSVWTVAAAIVTWWKNNSFTQAAIAADHMMANMKNKGE